MITNKFRATYLKISFNGKLEKKLFDFIAYNAPLIKLKKIIGESRIEFLLWQYYKKFGMCVYICMDAKDESCC